MCLIIRNKEGLIAEEDIECYKVLKREVIREFKDDSLINIYSTFYRGDKVKLKKKYRSKFEINNSHLGSVYFIEKGLHSFVSMKDVFKSVMKSQIRARLKRTYLAHDVIVVKAYIPKGSTYYKGRFNCTSNSYASNAIVYTDEVMHVYKR